MKATILAIVLFVPAILLFSFCSLIYNQSFADQLLDSYSSNPDSAKFATKYLIDYFQGKTVLPPPIFNDEEAAHLADVKTSIRNLQIAFIISSITFFLAFWFADKARVLRIGCIALFIISLLALVTPFDLLFDTMHRLLFEPGSWFFPPESLLITYYPVSFFAAYAFWIFVQALLLSVALALLSFAHRRG